MDVGASPLGARARHVLSPRPSKRGAHARHDAAAVVLRAVGEGTRVLGVPAPAKRLEPHGLCHLEAWLDVVVCRFEPQGLGGAGVGARGGAWAAPDLLGAQAAPPITVSQGALRGMWLRPARYARALSGVWHHCHGLIPPRTADREACSSPARFPPGRRL